MQPFVVKLGSLPSGTSHHEWHAGAEFFGIFGNSDILDADMDVKATIHNHGITIDVEVDMKGTVTVPCDRCLEDLVIPVTTSFEESYTADGNDLDLSQDIYDFICVALPFRKIHPDGECNLDTLRYLSK